MEQVLGQQTVDNEESPLDNLIRQLQNQQNALGEEPSPDQQPPDPAGRPVWAQPETPPHSRSHPTVYECHV